MSEKHTGIVTRGPIDLRGIFFGKEDTVTSEITLAVAKQLLRNNPQMLKDLNKKHRALRGKGVAMVIVPQLNVVIGRVGDELRTIIPRISCTEAAIENLFQAYDDFGGYGVVSTSSAYDAFCQGLLGRRVDANEKNHLAAMNFFSESMKPEDYIGAVLERYITEYEPDNLPADLLDSIYSRREVTIRGNLCLTIPQKGSRRKKS